MNDFYFPTIHSFLKTCKNETFLGSSDSRSQILVPWLDAISVSNYFILVFI